MPTALPDGFLAELRRRLDALYGDRLVRAVLFGSHARGEARADSDVDVLVVLRGAVDAWDEARALSAVALDALLDHGELVSFVVRSEAEADEPRPLMEVVRVEGVPLAA